MTEMTNFYSDIPPVMTVPEAAHILRIGRNAMYKLVSNGLVKSFQNGRIIRISRLALVNYIEATF